MTHMITIDEQAAFAKHFGTPGLGRAEDDVIAGFLTSHAGCGFPMFSKNLTKFQVLHNFSFG